MRISLLLRWTVQAGSAWGGSASIDILHLIKFHPRRKTIKEHGNYVAVCNVDTSASHKRKHAVEDRRPQIAMVIREGKRERDKSQGFILAALLSLNR